MESNKLLELYKIHSNRQHEWLTLWLTAASIYTSLISALGAGIVISIFYYYTHPYFLITSVGPILTIMLSLLAKKTCSRFYTRFLEDVSISIKIEEELELHSSRNINDSSAFPQDHTIFPERWVVSRKDFRTSEQFINGGMNEGVNKHLILIFNGIIALSILGLLLIIGILIKS